MGAGLKDFRLILWNIPAERIPSRPLAVNCLDIDQASNPELVGMLNDGWRIVSHTLTPMRDGGVLLSLFLERVIEVPGSL